MVPFAALQDSKGVSLIEKHTLSLAPSIHALMLTAKCRQLQKMPADFSKSLVVRDLTFGHQPELETEVREVADVLKAQVCQSKEGLMSVLGDAGVIHFTTPAILDEMIGFVGAMVLESTDEHQQLLTLSEVMALELNAELVVLSQGDLSRGRVWGQGVVAISNAWIHAGVPSLVLSLGSCSQTPSTFLMGQFYQNWQKFGNKVQALRQAMLATKQVYSHPRHWAVFVLVGEA